MSKEQIRFATLFDSDPEKPVVSFEDVNGHFYVIRFDAESVIDTADMIAANQDLRVGDIAALADTVLQTFPVTTFYQLQVDNCFQWFDNFYGICEAAREVAPDCCWSAWKSTEQSIRKRYRAASAHVADIDPGVEGIDEMRAMRLAIADSMVGEVR